MLNIAKIFLNDSLNNVQKITNICEWMIKDYCVSGNALLFALVYYSPNKFGRMIKNICNEKRINGIRNAAWDMCYLTSLFNRTKNDEKYYMFITNDKILIEIGNLMYSTNNDIDESEKRGVFFNKYWGKDFKVIQNVYESIICSNRIKQDRQKRIEKMLVVEHVKIVELENEIRAI